MKYVSRKYEKMLGDLAENLTVKKHLGEIVCVEEVDSAFSLPPNLRLATPPEAGWDYVPPEAA